MKRFLKMKGDNVKKAGKQLRACLSWRDTIVTGIMFFSSSSSLTRKVFSPVVKTTPFSLFVFSRQRKRILLFFSSFELSVKVTKEICTPLPILYYSSRCNHYTTLHTPEINPTQRISIIFFFIFIMIGFSFSFYF